MHFNKKRFHAIIALYSIFHIPREEQQNLFQKMYDLLENDGIVLMTLGTGESDSVEKDWCGAPMAWSNYGPSRYRTMIAQANFEIIESEYEGQPGDKEYHWWVIVKKKGVIYDIFKIRKEVKVMTQRKDLAQVRQSLIEELEAINLYEERIQASNNESLKKLLAHNRDEEKEHAVMLIDYLRENDPVFNKMFSEHD